MSQLSDVESCRKLWNFEKVAENVNSRGKLREKKKLRKVTESGKSCDTATTAAIFCKFEISQDMINGILILCFCTVKILFNFESDTPPQSPYTYSICQMRFKYSMIHFEIFFLRNPMYSGIHCLTLLKSDLSFCYSYLAIDNQYCLIMTNCRTK